MRALFLSIGSELVLEMCPSRFSRYLGIKRFLHRAQGSMGENNVQNRVGERSVASKSWGYGPKKREQWGTDVKSVTDVIHGSCAEERGREMKSFRVLKNMTPGDRTRRLARLMEFHPVDS